MQLQACFSSLPFLCSTRSGQFGIKLKLAYPDLYIHIYKHHTQQRTELEMPLTLSLGTLIYEVTTPFCRKKNAMGSAFSWAMILAKSCARSGTE